MNTVSENKPSEHEFRDRKLLVCPLKTKQSFHSTHDIALRGSAAATAAAAAAQAQGETHER